MFRDHIVHCVYSYFAISFLILCSVKFIMFFIFILHSIPFIQGTTEKIFATKRGAYDLFVNDKKLECSNIKFNKIKSINSADRARFKRLLKYRFVWINCFENLQTFKILTSFPKLNVLPFLRIDGVTISKADLVIQTATRWRV